MKGKETAVYVAAAVVVAVLIGWATLRKPAESAPEPIVPPSPVIPTETQASLPQPAPVPQPTGAPFKPPVTATAPPQSVRRMSVDELNERMQRAEVVVVDVRDAATYAAAHIPGSLHIPLDSVAGGISRLPRGKPIVTYCT